MFTVCSCDLVGPRIFYIFAFSYQEHFSLSLVVPWTATTKQELHGPNTFEKRCVRSCVFPMPSTGVACGNAACGLLLVQAPSALIRGQHIHGGLGNTALCLYKGPAHPPLLGEPTWSPWWTAESHTLARGSSGTTQCARGVGCVARCDFSGADGVGAVDLSLGRFGST